MQRPLRRAFVLLGAIALAASSVRAAGPETRPVSIETAHSQLLLYVASDGRLYQAGLGAPGQKVKVPAKGPNRADEFYPQAGDGFSNEPAIQVVHADGNTSTDLLYVGHETTAVDGNASLTRIELKDPAYPFFITLCLKAYRDEDVIEQWAEIRHDESGPVRLIRYLSASPLARGKEYWLSQFHGDYKHEATLVEERLTPGVKVLDSKLGVRAAKFRTPSFVVSLNAPADEESGEAIGGSLAWSGSFALSFDVDPSNRLRMLAGINPFGSEYHLLAGKTFTTPALLWSWSDQGKGQVSRNFHRWALKYGIRDAAKPRPVLLNNWEATHFDFDEEKIVTLFDGAKEVGADIFLLDDGWFGNNNPRNNDKAGLGDWQVNAKKLPRGLPFLADEARSRGIGFGIWIEPEMVNPASDLYLRHPDWVIRQPHRELDLQRTQLDLDLSRPAVKEFVWKVVDDTLGSPGVAYVKWDANRFVSQPGSTYLSPADQSNLLVDYNFALYDVMARMAQKYPGVMAMGCAGGGGRADYGALKYFHSFWLSDNTDPRGRVLIQWGFGHFFPSAACAAHVTRMGNRPLKFAVDVAMSGAFGLDLDVAKLTADEKAYLRAAADTYRTRVRDVTAKGDLYRIESPYERPRAALDYVSPDRGRAVLYVYQMKDAQAELVRLRGLDPKRRYRVEELNLPAGTPSRLDLNGKTVDGETLLRDGIIPTCSKQDESMVVEFAEVSQ